MSTKTKAWKVKHDWVRHRRSKQGRGSLSLYFIFKLSAINKPKQKSNMPGEKWISKTKSHTCTLFMRFCAFDCMCCYPHAVERWRSGSALPPTLLGLIWSERVSRSVRRVNISAVQAPSHSANMSLTISANLLLLLLSFILTLFCSSQLYFAAVCELCMLKGFL